jgi:hypothetical protein
MTPTTSTPDELGAAHGSALDDALALIALGPQRSANAVEWCRVSLEMCKHCKGTENVNEAAARIVAERMKTYDRKLRLLTKEQHRMRDPERTLLCDIIANGQLLPDPNGSRYGPNIQDVQPRERK